MKSLRQGSAACGSTAPFASSEPATAAAELLHPARQAIAQTRDWLLSQQQAEGHWVAELEGDTILESETILLLAFLGCPPSDLTRRLAAYLVEKQLPEGGWAMYPGGAAEISGSVKAYFALKLCGHDVDAGHMQRARAVILARGGADAVNSFTRFYLAMLGQIPYAQCPAVPPEIMLLPRWFPVNLYAVSTWSRTIIVPLSIVSALEPVRPIEPQRGIHKLFWRNPKDWPPLRCPGRPANPGRLSWDRFFRTVDRMLKWYQRRATGPLRRRALAAAESWMLARFDGSDGLGAIYPPIVWSLVALRALGYPDDSPEVEYCHEQLSDLVLDDPQSGTARLQPCKSPVWDTAITVRALSAAGLGGDHPGMARAARWLLDRQIIRPGDWRHTVEARPGGWCFEYNNDFYPDSDDTAMTLMALQEPFAERRSAIPVGNALRGVPGTLDGVPGALDGVPGILDPAECHRGHSLQEAECHRGHSLQEAECHRGHSLPELVRAAAAIDRGMKWMLAMQNRDGGWAAFDRNNNRRFLCRVPFADHNAMIDPSTPDLSGRVLEALGSLGRRVGDPAVDRGVRYLRRAQEPDGSWFGRWGVNYIYGTWQVLVGLTRVGVPAADPAIVAGARWLLGCQQSCGGWGESAGSYADTALRGQGPPTASQTAWAVMGLLSAGLADHPATGRGIRFLVDRQLPGGTWEEAEFTGTGFPQVFYLRYHYYPIYFPLLALARWAAAAAPPKQAEAKPQAAIGS